MKDKTQYNQLDVAGDNSIAIPVTKPKLTRTTADIKIGQLEEQLSTQYKEIAKLRRDLSRLKSAIGDIESVIKNRG